MKKLVTTFAIVFCLLSSVAFAEVKPKSINAYFQGIKVFINGKQIDTTTLEPFIYNDSTYVPLRPIVEGMGGTPNWDGPSNTISIVNNQSDVSSMNTQITILNSQLRDKENTIKTLQEKVSDLEDEIDDLEDDNSSSSSDVEDVEDILNDDYDTYSDDNSDMEFDYSLTKSSSKIKVEMNGDFSRDDDEWQDRDEDEFQSFIEDDVVDEVIDEFDDRDVQVIVYDEDDKKIGEYFYDYGDEDFTVEDEY